MKEREYLFPGTQRVIRELFIREKGKGNAINEGIRWATNDLICVLDADCILKDNALSQAKLKAQCLISGAFGVFRKSVLLQMNGYDTDTVGGYGIGSSITGLRVSESWQSDCV